MSTTTGETTETQRRGFLKSLGWEIENLLGGMVLGISCILITLIIGLAVVLIAGVLVGIVALVAGVILALAVFILAVLAVIAGFLFAPLLLAFWFPPEIYLSTTGAWAVFWAWGLTNGIRSSIEEEKKKGKDPFAFLRDR